MVLLNRTGCSTCYRRRLSGLWIDHNLFAMKRCWDRCCAFFNRKAIFCFDLWWLLELPISSSGGCLLRKRGFAMHLVFCQLAGLDFQLTGLLFRFSNVNWKFFSKSLSCLYHLTNLARLPVVKFSKQALALNPKTRFTQNQTLENQIAWCFDSR